MTRIYTRVPCTRNNNDVTCCSGSAGRSTVRMSASIPVSPSPGGALGRSRVSQPADHLRGPRKSPVGTEGGAGDAHHERAAAHQWPDLHRPLNGLLDLGPCAREVRRDLFPGDAVQGAQADDGAVHRCTDPRRCARAPRVRAQGLRQSGAPSSADRWPAQQPAPGVCRPSLVATPTRAPWSSQAARWVHSPEVAGSSPAGAT